MEKQRSLVIIYKRGNSYFANVSGCFGGGYQGAHAGDTPEEAALFAIREKQRYIATNPEGGEIFAPAEVREAITAAKAA